MRRFKWLSFALAALALQAFAPIVGAANGPNGSSPDMAIPITAVMNGTLPQHQTRWYSFAGDGSNPAAVTMQYQPASGSNTGVLFNVDWTVASGQQNADWPGYYRIGQGTPSGLGLGKLYWYTGSTTKTTYDVELVNNTDLPVGYALALTGSTFPPPILNVPAPGSTATGTAPSSTPVPTPAPVATATPVPATQVNAATDRSGLILAPQVTTEGPLSTVHVRIESSSPELINIGRLVVIPPNGAVVDAVTPFQTRLEQGITWYLNQLVNQNNPLSSYSVRFYGSADGTVVQADWSTSSGKGVLSLTIEGAPQPAPIGQ